jgi:hypothetical protein
MKDQIYELAEAIAEGMRAHEIEKHFHNVVQIMIHDMNEKDVNIAKQKALDILNNDGMINDISNTTLH